MIIVASLSLSAGLRRLVVLPSKFSAEHAGCSCAAHLEVSATMPWGKKQTASSSALCSLPFPPVCRGDVTVHAEHASSRCAAAPGSQCHNGLEKEAHGVKQRLMLLAFNRATLPARAII